MKKILLTSVLALVLLVSVKAKAEEIGEICVRPAGTWLPICGYLVIEGSTATIDTFHALDRKMFPQAWIPSDAYSAKSICYAFLRKQDLAFTLAHKTTDVVTQVKELSNGEQALSELTILNTVTCSDVRPKFNGKS